MEKLNRSLSELREKVDAGTHDDPQLAGLVAGLDRDIREATVRPGGQTSPYESLSLRAQALSAQFAAQHPHIEAALRELADTLERMGI